MNPTGNTILVTGGGSGIGRLLARRLHDGGNFVIVAGRRLEALRETIEARPRMASYQFDADDADAIEAFARRVLADHPALNVLVNNAGIMRLEDASGRRGLEDAEAMIRTNLLGPIRITNSFVDHLARKPGAVVINVTSGLAFVPLASAPTYSATKAALHSYTVSLRQRLTGRVEVIEWVPPAVRTELTPGQSQRDGYMPLEDFVEQSINILQGQPTPQEILVEGVLRLRRAEMEGRFEEVLQALAAH